MLDDAPYREWTAGFNPGSYYVGNWEKGTKMLFLGTSEGEKEGGMIAYVEENRPHEFVSLKHVGMVKNGVEDTTSDEVKAWTPAYENYTFTSRGDTTEVVIDMDIAENYAEEFDRMWPAALQKLKDIAER